MEGLPTSAEAPVFETTWLQGIIEFQSRELPDGTRILTYTLGNGHRYVLPLSGNLLAMTQKAISPVMIVGADSIPPNHNGA